MAIKTARDDSRIVDLNLLKDGKKWVGLVVDPDGGYAFSGRHPYQDFFEFEGEGTPNPEELLEKFMISIRQSCFDQAHA